MDVPEDEQDPSYQEALRRSLCETNIGDSNFAAALAASLHTHDEEIARTLQMEQNLIYEQTLFNPTTATSSPNPAPEASKASSRTSSTASSSHSASQQQQQQLPQTPPRDSQRSRCPRPAHGPSSLENSHPCRPQRCPGDADQKKNSKPVASGGSPVVAVIDGQNVGWNYGKGRSKGNNGFSSMGVYKVVSYYRAQNQKVVALLPNRLVDVREYNNRVADDPKLLLRLRDEGAVAFTPAASHDDNFILSYAMKHNCCIVSNDRFRREVNKQETQQQKVRMQRFLNSHLIPYTFVNEEFMPNPNPNRLGFEESHTRG